MIQRTSVHTRIHALCMRDKICNYLPFSVIIAPEAQYPVYLAGFGQITVTQ
jgi:hypothetical protein